MSSRLPSFPLRSRAEGVILSSLMQSTPTAAIATGTDTALPTVSDLAITGFTRSGVVVTALVTGSYEVNMQGIYVPGAITDRGDIGYKRNGAATVWPVMQIIWSGQISYHMLYGRFFIALNSGDTFEFRVRSTGTNLGVFQTGGTFSLRKLQ